MDGVSKLYYTDVPKPNANDADHQVFVQKIVNANEELFTALNDNQLTIQQLSAPEASFHHKSSELADKAFDTLDIVLEYLEKIIKSPPRKLLAQQLFDGFIKRLQESCRNNLAVNLRLVKLNKEALKKNIQRQLADPPAKIKDFAQTLGGQNIHDIYDAIQDYFDQKLGNDNNHHIRDLLKGLMKKASQYKNLQENQKLKDLWLELRKKNFSANKNNCNLLLNYAVLELMFNSQNNYKYFNFAELIEEK